MTYRLVSAASPVASFVSTWKLVPSAERSLTCVSGWPERHENGPRAYRCIRQVFGIAHPYTSIYHVRTHCRPDSAANTVLHLHEDGQCSLREDTKTAQLESPSAVSTHNESESGHGSQKFMGNGTRPQPKEPSFRAARRSMAADPSSQTKSTSYDTPRANELSTQNCFKSTQIFRASDKVSSSQTVN